MSEKVVFHLKRFWDYEEGDVCPKCGHGILKDIGDGTLDCPNPDCEERFQWKVDLSEEIRNGRKTREWREATDYWIRRLTTLTPLSKLNSFTPLDKRFKEWANIPIDVASAEGAGIDWTKFLKVKRAWLVVGFPKYCIPRFEADITHLTLYPSTNQLETEFKGVEEYAPKE